ncbi:SMC-Scp complex subunit ScpB [Halobacteriovorax sp. XZX-3]|uniref:SMC-Scp complex subunit ScpB n=1 Tax=unclassified Halobacteriovorax TaxID=2639665 RepID=UPI000CD229D2|nr:SMC-Scp complex subunit ScpB [Halobacteriovorax sp. DA5]POB13820.1 SMC-Scp complex subunit ScpB [Halobacteriovorax sp. DA5]
MEENTTVTEANLEFLSTEEEMVEELEMALMPSDEDLEFPEEYLKLESDFADEKLQEDKLWKARTGLNEETICGAIETIVFMSDKPVPLMKIKSLIDEDIPLRVVHEAITRLQDEYELKHHGIRLQEVANGYQFRTKATFSKYVQDLFKINELVLSPTALEVLAIIAYKQPVSKIEVEKIRGVDSSHIVRGLMDKRLVRVTGRSEEVGRPVLYGTTSEFLEVFNLANIDQLPPEHELAEIATQGVGKIEDIKTLVNADLASRFDQDEIEELDNIAMSIKAIDSETAFTKSLKVQERRRKSGRTEEGEEAAPILTAFDLLEQHLDNSLVTGANKESAESEVFTAITCPEVIADLTKGPFNIPEEEEDDFEMIDLDSGEVIKDISVEEALEEVAEAILSSGSEEGLDEEDLINDEADIEVAAEQVEEIAIIDETKTDEEADQLAQALDDAFAKLFGGDSAVPQDEMEVDLDDSINETTQNLINGAKDLDLDLDFLNNKDLGDSESYID